MKIVVVNYGMGNVGSIVNMIRKVGGEAEVASDPKALDAAGKVLLPGVGSFDQGMQALAEGGWIDSLRLAAGKGIPILGICLGMQLMLGRSEEGRLPGLELVPGDVRRFPSGEGFPRLPHMGWNQIDLKKACPLFGSDEEEKRYYFAHSLHVVCGELADVAAMTVHGHAFVSAFQRNNLLGVQFHPEKSHRFGMALFKRFIEI